MKNKRVQYGFIALIILLFSSLALADKLDIQVVGLFSGQAVLEVNGQ